MISHRLGILICLVLPAAPAITTPVDSGHIQQSVELMNSGDLPGAEKEAKLDLGDASKRPLALSTLGAIRIRQKHYVEAAQFLNEALRLNPSLVPAQVTLAEVYFHTGKSVQARKQFRDVLDSDPDNVEARFGLAQLESESGNFTKSLSLAEPIREELRRSSEGILLLAKGYSGLNHKDSLTGLVHDWDNLPETSADSSSAFASLLVKSRLNQQALEVLEKAKSRGQVSYEMAVLLGNLYFSSGDFNGAFESYEAGLSLNPGCTDCLRQLAKIATKQQDPEKALAYLIKAKRQQPNDADILFEFGKACLELDLADDAVLALQKAARLQPNNDSYMYVLASANVAKKQYAAANKLFEALLAKHPDDPVLNYATGSLLFLEVKLDQAKKYLQRSVDLQPDQIPAYYYLGLIAEGKGDNNQASATFREVLRRDPQYGLAWEALGRVLLNGKQYPEAQHALEKAAALNPDSVKAHYQLGILWSRIGRQDDANKEFQIVQQLNADEEKRLGMRLRIISPH
jgi:tetratricopeptide (TPR) repeat protein